MPSNQLCLKYLLRNERLRALSFEAIMFYAVLLEATQNSDSIDGDGICWVEMSLSDVSEICRCGLRRAARIIHELDEQHGAGVIRIIKLSMGKMLYGIGRPVRKRQIQEV